MKRLLIILLVLSAPLVHAADYVIATGENGTEEVYVSEHMLHADWTDYAALWLPFPANKLAGTYYDYSPDSSDFTMATASQRPTWNSANSGHYRFDGDNDRISRSVSAGQDLTCSSDSVTFAFWMYQLSGGDWYQRIFDKSTGGNGANGYCLGTEYGGEGRFFLSVDGNRIGGVYDASPVYNVWVHIVVTWNGSQAVFYKNGAGKTAHVEGDDIPDTTGTLRIGTGYTTAIEFKGYLDDIRVYTRVLGDAEVTALYERRDTVYGHSDP